MKDNYKKICFLLASADLKEEEILDFAKYIRNVSSTELVKQVSSARRVILAVSGKDHDEVSKKNVKISSSADTLEEKVIQLLIINAGLTKGAAANALINTIQEKYPEILLPSFGKMSFSDWIKKLGQHLSPSEVLHFASTIRNQHVHDKNSDWVLK